VIVVSDTSPLRYLILIGHAEVLPQLYGTVICPPEVISECLHANAPAAVRDWASSPPEWLQVMTASAQNFGELQRLDLGEAAAIRLACDQHADMVLIDERKGRRIAMALGFRVAGILGVLADAAIARLLDFQLAVENLTENTNFRVSERVLALIRSRLPTKP
jgi:predicted nucleic acid-binding protein